MSAVTISAAVVKDLREATGAGMMDCKKALSETNGDFDAAIKLLREKGLGAAAKKADRLASEGLIGLHVEAKSASLVEINSETDFVAKNDRFVSLVEKSAAAVQSLGSVTVESLSAAVIDGKVFSEYLSEQIATIGENLVLRRVARLSGDVVSGYLHANGKIGAIISAKISDESKKDAAAAFLKNLCMHIAAMAPKVMSYKDFDASFVEEEYAALKGELEKENEELVRLNKPLHKIPQFASRAQITDAVLAQVEADIKQELIDSKKPEKIWDKIIPGKIASFLADNTLLDSRLTLFGQFYVMDDKKTVEEVIGQKAAEMGCEFEIVEFVRFELGEGLEKKVEDFAAEVAAQL